VVRTADGNLVITPSAVNLDAKRNTSFYARRQAHQRFAASTEFAPPRNAGTAAGLAAYQNEDYWYFLGAVAPTSACRYSSSAMPARTSARSRRPPSKCPIRSS
jgi:beta-xylosidase